MTDSVQSIAQEEDRSDTVEHYEYHQDDIDDYMESQYDSYLSTYGEQ